MTEAGRYRIAAEILRRCPEREFQEKAAEFERLAKDLETKSLARFITVSYNYRRFGSAWPRSWERELEKGPVIRSNDGILQGVVNLDTGKAAEAILAISGAAVNAPNRRGEPFALFTANYPRLPGYYDLLEDAGTILSCHGLSGQPAVWAAQGHGGFHVHLASCRVSRFPDENGRYRFLEPLVIDSITRPNGKIHRQLNHLASCHAAAWRLNEKYGYSTDGLSYDGEGKCVGEPLKSRFSL